MKIKDLEVKDLFRIRDAIKTLVYYFDLRVLRKIEKEIQIRLDEERGGIK